MGLCGIKGMPHTKNLTEECDMIFSLGCRFSPTFCMGNPKTFAKKAFVISVNNDSNELNLNLKKNSRIFLISSLAIDAPEIGNAYYSISKKALNFAVKIWNQEYKKRNPNIINIKVGIIKNKMGLNVNRLAKTKKNSKILSQDYVANKIFKILNNYKIKNDIIIK